MFDDRKAKPLDITLKRDGCGLFSFLPEFYAFYAPADHQVSDIYHGTFAKAVNPQFRFPGCWAWDILCYSEIVHYSHPLTYGSVIGTNNQATINYNSAISELKEKVESDTSEDKEQLEKIVSLLEMVVNDQVPPSKGLFSKFSEVMERNSWITGSVAGARV